ncbi:MAG: Na+/H+ antiporter NhaC [Lysobacteraceae bacterium]
MTHASPRQPSLLQALTPLAVLVVLLILAVYLFADDAVYGASQVALLLAAAVASLVGIRNGLKWEQIQDSMVAGLAVAVTPILILLAVGALIGTWILCGTVPTLIVYGMELLHPSYFYPAVCLITAIAALVIGSSWTVAGTLGVALIGVAQGMEMSLPITAGAIISGAYFGDKISPLSDTTILAPAVSGAELFAHIRNLVWTTAPSLAIALVMFALIGAGDGGGRGDGAAFGELPAVLQSRFNLGWHLLLPMVVVFTLAFVRFPAYPTILIGALLGAVFGVIFQPEAVVALADNEALSRPMALLAGAWSALFGGYQVETGNAGADDLLTRGGMASMLNTAWLVICAMCFGAVMERVGLLERLIRGLLSVVHSARALVVSTLVTAVGTNIVTADQYMSLVLPGKLFQSEYERRGLSPLNLSRALEDGGTITSPLIPWNTCGAFMAATLGVATLDYLPYAFFNLVNLGLAFILAWVGFRLLPLVKASKVPATDS